MSAPKKTSKSEKVNAVTLQTKIIPLKVLGKNLNILYWNVNGIRAVIRKCQGDKNILKRFVSIFDNNHVIYFAETKTSTNEQAAECEKFMVENIPNFRSFRTLWTHSTRRKGYAGLFCATNVEIESMEAVEMKCCPGEGRIIEVRLKNHDVRIVGVYVMNAGGDLKRLQLRTENWDKEFHDYCNKHNTVVIGDMNVAPAEIDVYNSKKCSKLPGHTPQERESYYSSFGKNFKDIYRSLEPEKREYTFFSAISNARSRNDGWRIDHIHTNIENAIPNQTNHYAFFESDHIPISAKFDTQTLRS